MTDDALLDRWRTERDARLRFERTDRRLRKVAFWLLVCSGAYLAIHVLTGLIDVPPITPHPRLTAANRARIAECERTAQAFAAQQDSTTVAVRLGTEHPLLRWKQIHDLGTQMVLCKEDTEKMRQ